MENVITIICFFAKTFRSLRTANNFVHQTILAWNLLTWLEISLQLYFAVNVKPINVHQPSIQSRPTLAQTTMKFGWKPRSYRIEKGKNETIIKLLSLLLRSRISFQPKTSYCYAPPIFYSLKFLIDVGSQKNTKMKLRRLHSDLGSLCAPCCLRREADVHFLLKTYSCTTE